MNVLFLPDYREANAYQRLLAEALERRGVRVTADRTGRRRLLPILGAVRRHGRPSVLHVHWTEPYISGGRVDVSRAKAARSVAELRLLRAAGVRIVWTAHDLSRHDRAVDPREVAFTRALFGLSDAVIVHCEAARDGLLDALRLPARDASRVEVIPHGNYLGAYADEVDRTTARERLGVPAEARVVSFVGWVRPYKGVTELLDAFAGVADPLARLVIAGKPGGEGFAEEVERRAAADPRVSLHLGFVPDDELQVHLRAADVVALPYREIFTSGSVLLAMSFGRAVVAPRRGCIGETLDADGAVLYDGDDPAGLRRAIETALAADLVAMGEHNLRRARSLGWDAIAARTAEVYRRITR